ncbi:SIMPL domain-containing protein [Salegentibacter sp. F188]|uniref:SIMPL domain-containing protein n=1 Tax=Autumnicola patrickiae TaxID=3075591 RepID=A0ABU3E1E0_9FLAO|nr:SIMPL domain-containing protein [Salegentibacter sp. F188]MDT0689782.1 SIMPL domain-containing protein [Salegentibacter sp. F188]
MIKKIFILMAILIAVGAGAQENQSNLVNVTGEGTVNVVPDQVVIKARIEHEGESATAVKKQNDEAVNNVIKFLKKAGVQEKNINTDYIRLNKSYNYNEKTYSFSANQAISITLEDIKDYEMIMSGLLEEGLNRIDGVEFKSSEAKKYETEARKKAVLDAKRKAEELVAPLDQEIGKAVAITEGTINSPQPMYRMAMMEDSSKSSPESIAPGEMEITVNVNVGFLLK